MEKNVNKPSDGCFASITMPSGHRVFVADVQDEKRQGKLGFSGGGMDKGEVPQDAARRELLEELGVVITEPMKYIVHRAPEVNSAFSATHLFDAGKNWDLASGKRRVMKNFVPQASEISRVVLIHSLDILNNRDLWLPQFYTGHRKMLGWLLRHELKGLSVATEAPLPDDPWELGLV